MSTAAPVPETWELTGDDARETLLNRGRRSLVLDAFQRMRSADGFSHARSTAFLVCMLLVQAIIALVGLAIAMGNTSLSEGIVSSIQSAVPGPAGEFLTNAVTQASQVGQSKRYLALVVGLVGTLITGTTVMGQLERGLNRLYGVEQDRPARQKYGRAFVMAVSVGALVAVAFVSIGFGTTVGDRLHNGVVDATWMIVRWPIGIGLMVAAMALLFKLCPNRRQPAWSWLAFGATVSVLLWVAVTIALGLVFRFSTSFGDTYGPLAGIVALQLWALLSSMGILFGGSVAAQLEAVRSGRPQPSRPDTDAGMDPGGEDPLAAVRREALVDLGAT